MENLEFLPAVRRAEAEHATGPDPVELEAELRLLAEIQATRSAPLMALVHRAARHPMARL